MPKKFDPRNFALGALEDLRDDRDFLATSFLPTITLPEYINYRPSMTPVKNQKALGSCVAFATAAMAEYYNSLEFNRVLDFSEQWLYDKCKTLDGWAGPGTFPRTSMTVLLNNGIPEEIYQPYEAISPARNACLEGTLENATKYKIITYAAIRSLDSFKQALATSGPAVISLKVYDSFYNIGSDGIIPNISGNMIGGHALCCCGYDDNKVTPLGTGALIIKNSWSDRFGDKGYVYLPYSIYSNLVVDGWTMIDAKLIDYISVWPDWRKDATTGLFIEETAAKLVKSKSIFNGYPDGTFHPDGNLLQRQVKIVMGRLVALKNRTQFPNQYIEGKIDGYDIATRAWTRDTFPGLQWDSQRWEEPLTRFQFVLLIARYIASQGI